MADQTSDAPLDSSTPSTVLPGSSTSPASGSEPALARNVSFSKLNAQAPEFVPMKTQSTPAVAPRIAIAPPPPSTPQTVSGMVHVYGAPSSPSNVPIQAMVVQNHHHHPHMHNQQHHVHYHHHPQHPHHHQKIHQFYGGGEQDAVVQGQQLQYDKDHGNTVAWNGISEEATQKILNQVEYYFSDVNLATTDHLIRFINKDPEGYVPISVVASFKKIKALISNNSQLAVVLRNSTKLVVSDDGKKVKRVHPLTDMEELQARIIVAENLPEDHCHQNLMKVFSSVGSVKSIRTCQPQASNNGASSASRSSKGENMLHSNKLHAFVEYESIELAEKAVVELNDEGHWRNGLRVRLLLKRMSKSVQARAKKAGNEGEGTCEDDDTSTSEQNQNDKQAEDSFGPYDVYSQEHLGEEQVGEKEGGQKKGRNRGRGKGRGRGHQHQANRGTNVGPPTSNQANSEQLKHPPPGPRMPDGTRGFSMGRGKPVAVNTA